MKRNQMIPTAFFLALATTALALTLTRNSSAKNETQVCTTKAPAVIASALSFTTPKPEKLLFRVVPGQGTLITPRQLQTVDAVTDLMPDFPINWIASYQSVALDDAQGNTVSGKNIQFNAQQKALLQRASINSSFKLHVAYYKMGTNQKGELRTMEVLFNVVPERHAQFGNGYQALMDYLDQAGIQAFNPSKHPEAEGLMVNFLVTAQGAVTDIEFSKALSNKASEEKLRNMLMNMPSWSPAKNASGVSVDQKFWMQLGMWDC